jgi:NAD(P)-dependent dehydrogenase (short-subunit alcohol dehydrogenase family)
MPTAIVTGASRGLGYALATQLADAGWSLIIDARHADALHDAAERLRALRPAADRIVVEPVVGDIADPAHRAELIHAAAAHGRLDLLVNNAGILGPSPLPPVAELSSEALREIVEVNVVAPHELTRAALPMLRLARGVVIDVTSDAAVEAYPGWGGYGAAKAATEQLRHVLAAEEPEVTVWRVDPGDLRTQMHQLAFPGEDISDRPLPETVAPGLLGLLDSRPPTGGRYRLADYVHPVAKSDPVALWITVEVDDFEPAARFYREGLGLAQVDSWTGDDGETGAVYAAGPAARIELERPARPTSGGTPARIAIEYAGLDALTTAHDRIAAANAARPTEVVKHHRGHSGFTVHDPHGTEVYLWSEE